MKIGAEDKNKVIALGVLGVIAAIAVYSNFTPSTPSTPTPGAVSQRNSELEGGTTTAPVTNAPAAPVARAPQSKQSRFLGTGRSRISDEFIPVLRKKNARPEDLQLPADLDPTLHLDRLVKVQSAKLEGGQRNLFQFGVAEAVKTAELPKGVEPVVKQIAIYGPKQPPPPVDPPKPVEPKFQSNLKYYGLATKRIDNKKTAFFLDGEDIILATEGMVVKGHFKLVRIGTESVLMEDTDIKKTGSIIISEDAPSGTGN